LPDPYQGRSHETPLIPQIMRVIDQLVASEDDTGCSDGLTVVESAPVDKLKAIHDTWRSQQ
jgi:hypothetical protein